MLPKVIVRSLLAVWPMAPEHHSMAMSPCPVTELAPLAWSSSTEGPSSHHGASMRSSPSALVDPSRSGGHVLRTVLRAALIVVPVVACGHPSTASVNSVYPVVSADSRALVTNHFATESHVERMLSRAATGDTTEHESVVTTVDEIVP
jgi:hypothetical protein